MGLSVNWRSILACSVHTQFANAKSGLRWALAGQNLLCYGNSGLPAVLAVNCERVGKRGKQNEKEFSPSPKSGERVATQVCIERKGMQINQRISSSENS